MMIAHKHIWTLIWTFLAFPKFPSKNTTMGRMWPLHHVCTLSIYCYIVLIRKLTMNKSVFEIYRWFKLMVQSTNAVTHVKLGWTVWFYGNVNLIIQKNSSMNPKKIVPISSPQNSWKWSTPPPLWIFLTPPLSWDRVCQKISTFNNWKAFTELH